MAEAGVAIELVQAGPIPLDVSFDIAPGELVALVGPSGSGKSTVLRSIAGLHRPRAGRVRVDGTRWLDREPGIDLPPRRREVGYVFQNYALFPHLSALDNVGAAITARDRGERTQRARALLRRVHLDGLEQRLPNELSGGQQQRVAVARALAGDPRILLLDEPFSAVDRVTREKLQRELAALRADLNIPILFVTHDLGEAVRLADRIGVIHRGRLLQLAEPDTVMYRPASPLAARLVDIRNVFEATVLGHDPDRDTTRIDWLGRTLETPVRPEFEPGRRVGWCIPADCIILHRRDRPSRGERENPVHGTVTDAVRLGEMTHVRIAIEGSAQPLELQLPTHAARRNRVSQGEAVGVSLRAGAIHLMEPVAHEDSQPGSFSTDPTHAGYPPGESPDPAQR